MLVPENQSPTVAVLLPCYNEEVTIGKVVPISKRLCHKQTSTFTTIIPLIAPPISLRQREQSSARSRDRARAT